MTPIMSSISSRSTSSSLLIDYSKRRASVDDSTIILTLSSSSRTSMAAPFPAEPTGGLPRRANSLESTRGYSSTSCLMEPLRPSLCSVPSQRELGYEDLTAVTTSTVYDESEEDEYCSSHDGDSRVDVTFHDDDDDARESAAGPHDGSSTSLNESTTQFVPSKTATSSESKESRNDSKTSLGGDNSLSLLEVVAAHSPKPPTRSRSTSIGTAAAAARAENLLQFSFHRRASTGNNDTRMSRMHQSLGTLTQTPLVAGGRSSRANHVRRGGDDGGDDGGSDVCFRLPTRNSSCHDQKKSTQHGTAAALPMSSNDRLNKSLSLLLQKEDSALHQLMAASSVHGHHRQLSFCRRGSLDRRKQFGGRKSQSMRMTSTTTNSSGKPNEEGNNNTRRSSLSTASAHAALNRESRCSAQDHPHDRVLGATLSISNHKNAASLSFCCQHNNAAFSASPSQPRVNRRAVMARAQSDRLGFGNSSQHQQQQQHQQPPPASTTTTRRGSLTTHVEPSRPQSKPMTNRRNLLLSASEHHAGATSRRDLFARQSSFGGKSKSRRNLGGDLDEPGSGGGDATSFVTGSRIRRMGSTRNLMLDARA